MTWDEHAIQTLKELTAQGLSASLIAKELGTTRNAVLGKLWRLGIQRQRPKAVSTRRRGPSRFRVVNGRRVAVSFPPEMHAAITDMAKQKDCSFGEAVRELVDCGLCVEASLA